MMTVGPGLTSFTLGAGEPFLFQVAFQNADGSRSSRMDRTFVLAFYKADRSQVATIDGELSSDGSFIRFEEDGSLSDKLYGQGVTVELAERLRGGREDIVTGTLVVKPTANSIATLDNGAVGNFAVRAIIKDTDETGDKVSITSSVILYVAPGTPGPSVTARPSIATDGTPQVGETMTGQSGTYSNGSVAGHAWLLGGTAISGATGATYVPDQAGQLTYRETVTGPGGTITSTSDAVTVAGTTPALNGFYMNGATPTKARAAWAALKSGTASFLYGQSGHSIVAGTGANGQNTPISMAGTQPYRRAAVMAAAWVTDGVPALDQAFVADLGLQFNTNASNPQTGTAAYDSRVSYIAATINGDQNFAGGGYYSLNGTSGNHVSLSATNSDTFVITGFGTGNPAAGVNLDGSWSGQVVDFGSSGGVVNRTYTAPSAGDHTVSMNDSCNISGIRAYNSAIKSLQFIVYASCGATSAQQSNGGNGSFVTLDRVKADALNFATWQCLANDMATGVSVSDHIEHMAAWVAAVRLTGDAMVIFDHPLTFGFTPTVSQATYHAAVKQWCAENNVPFLSYWEIYGSGNDSSFPSRTIDGVHPNRALHAEQADYERQAFMLVVSP